MSSYGQSVLEYILLIGIVTLALIYMGTDFKRGLQSVLKVTADQMGNQADADQNFDQGSPSGYLVQSMSNTTQVHDQDTLPEPGSIKIIVKDSMQSSTESISNTGFTAY